MEEGVDAVVAEDDPSAFGALRGAVGDEFDEGDLKAAGGSEAVAAGASGFRRAVHFADAGGGEFVGGDVAGDKFFEFFDGVGFGFYEGADASGVAEVEVADVFWVLFAEVDELGNDVFVEAADDDGGEGDTGVFVFNERVEGGEFVVDAVAAGDEGVGVGVFGSSVHGEAEAEGGSCVLQWLQGFHEVGVFVAHAVGADVEAVVVFGGDADEVGQVGMQGGFAAGEFEQDGFGERLAEGLELFDSHVGIGAVAVVAVVAGHVAACGDVYQYGGVGVLAEGDAFVSRGGNGVVGVSEFAQLFVHVRSSFAARCFIVLYLYRFVPVYKTLMNCKIIQVGAFDVNCAVLFSESGSALVVDPGFDAARILEVLGARRVEGYLLTHSHPDHLSALNELHAQRPAPVVVHAVDLARTSGPRNRIPPHYERPVMPDAEYIHPESSRDWMMGGYCFQCLETPGHTPGGVCYWFEDDGVCFTGDTLLRGRIARSSRKLGDERKMARSLRRLAALPPETMLVPGHGEVTTLADELQNNLALREAMDEGCV